MVNCVKALAQIAIKTHNNESWLFGILACYIALSFAVLPAASRTVYNCYIVCLYMSAIFINLDLATSDTLTTVRSTNQICGPFMISVLYYFRN
jgi:hypothetical protein